MGSRNAIHGSYLGEIVDTNDPQKQYRYKVQVFSIFDGVPVKDLPWATVRQPVGSRRGEGFATPLRKKDVVEVVFMNNDSRYPHIVGGFPSSPQGLPNCPDDFFGGPNELIHKRHPEEPPVPPVQYNLEECSTFNGITISRKANHYLVTHRKTGTAMEISQDGHIVFHSERQVFLSSKKETKFHCKEWITKVEQALQMQVKQFSILAKQVLVKVSGSSKEEVGGKKQISAGMIGLAALENCGIAAKTISLSAREGITVGNPLGKVEIEGLTGGITVETKAGVSISNLTGKVEIDPITGHITIENTAGNLKEHLTQIQETMKKMIDEINQIAVPTPVGLSGPPTNATKFELIKTEIEALNTALKTFLK